jgi:predicted Zn finger-like uncharacterized protein
MAETNITRCPHCQTTFRIRLEQLAAAKGAVRCGSCLQVFKAADHIVSGAKVSEVATKSPVSASPAQEPPVQESEVHEVKVEEIEFPAADHITPHPTEEPATDSAKKEFDADDGLFDDIPDQINDDPLEDFGIRQPDRDNNETFENSLQLDDAIFGVQDDRNTSRFIMNDDRDIEFGSDQFGSHDNTDDAWAAILMADDKKPSKKSDPEDESWAEALLDVDEDLIEDIDMCFTKENVAKQEDDFVPSLEDEPESDQFHLSGDDGNSLDTVEIELTIAGSVNDLLDEPLNLDNKKKQKTSATSHPNFLWLWLSGAMVMIFALIAQVGYFKFDSWSRNPNYRPVYEASCQLLNCQLPAIQNIKKMNTQHFMVRPHPKVKDALYIDTLIINHADYEQPFPDLNLIFTGLNEQTVASRHFKPKEYLAGELAGSNIMPLNIPIHIAIEIASPGAEAVGYRIELVGNH